jgi:hypothetical protein
MRRRTIEEESAMADKGRPPVYQSDEDKPVTVSLRVPRDLYSRLEHYRLIHRQSITEVLLDGLRLRLETPTDPRDLILSDDNAVIQELQEMIRAQVQAEMGKLNAFRDSASNVLKSAPTTQPAIPLALEPAPSTTTESVPELLHDNNTVILNKPTPRRGRQPGTTRQRILDLLAEHPEGLSPEQIRVFLNAEKPIGDILQGMRRAAVVELQGEGYQKRYFLSTK